MELQMSCSTTDLNFKATELRLGLPGTDETEVRSNKRKSTEISEESRLKGSSTVSDAGSGDRDTAPPAKALVVGWPPIRSYRKNNFQMNKSEIEASGMCVKVSMDGAPYLRKIDLRVYKSYPELLMALETLFNFTIGKFLESEGYNGSDYEPTYQDKDGDWMLLGDVPWDMFITSCKRLRIMKG